MWSLTIAITVVLSRTCVGVFIFTDPVDAQGAFSDDQLLRYGRHGTAVPRRKAV